MVDLVGSEPFSTAESRHRAQFWSKLIPSRIAGYADQNVSMSALAIYHQLRTIKPFRQVSDKPVNRTGGSFPDCRLLARDKVEKRQKSNFALLSR